VGLCKRRLQANRGFELHDGWLDFSGGVEDPAKVVVRFGAAGIQANGGLEVLASSGIVTALQSSKTLICDRGGASRSGRFGRSRRALCVQGKCGKEKGQERGANLIPESNARTEHAPRPPKKLFTSY
jgi:hypothetical protein